MVVSADHAGVQRRSRRRVIYPRVMAADDLRVRSDHPANNNDAAVALVALVLDDILTSDAVDRDALLSTFVCAAWPSPRAERQ